MLPPRKPVRTDDGLVHFKARNVELLVCRGDGKYPDFVYAPADTAVTCVRCLWHVDVLDALRLFRDALP